MSESHSDFSGILNKVITNPDAMQQIIKLAGDLKNSGSGAADGENQQSEGDGKHIEEPVDDGGGDKHEKGKKESGEADDNRIKLLVALKPYLNDERRDKADIMIRMLKLLRFTDLNELSNLLGEISK